MVIKKQTLRSCGGSLVLPRFLIVGVPLLRGSRFIKESNIKKEYIYIIICLARNISNISNISNGYLWII